MAGLYIHIPFCRKQCYYCDFHFTVSFKYKDQLIDALCREIENRSKEYLQVEIDTIYFGGGTPSILSVKDLINIFETIHKNYKIAQKHEITFESNPEDLTKLYLKDLRNHTPINRLSVGVQSFNRTDLLLMNRRHTAKESIESIEQSKKAGFTNINIDLIYGIPGMGLKTWQDNLEMFKRIDVVHLSAYHLSFEPKTVFSYYLKKGRLNPITEELSVKQFEMLISFAENNGYDHYEISNFAKEGFYSKHNLGYWTGKSYIGIGPSAHSYFMNKRRWNISNNTKYCEALLHNSSEYFEREVIDNQTAYNEYLLTSLRTKWGIDKDLVKAKFGSSYFSLCYKAADRFLKNGTLLDENGHMFLSKKGILIADYVIAEMIVAE